LGKNKYRLFGGTASSPYARRRCSKLVAAAYDTLVGLEDEDGRLAFLMRKGNGLLRRNKKE
jgi:hypothetical protein